MLNNKIDNFLQILKLHESYLIKFIDNQMKNMALSLGNACDFPNLSSPIETMYRQLRIDKDLVKEIIILFSDEIKKVKQVKSIYLASDDKTHFLILLVLYFLRKNNLSYAIKCNFLIMCKHYGNLMRKYLNKYCDPTLFYRTLDHISKTHLFSKHKGILEALLYLNKSLFLKYKSHLLKYNVEAIFLFIYESRHRINQSCKSFVNKYRQLQKTKNFQSNKLEKNNDLSQQIEESSKLKLTEKIMTELLVYKKIYPEVIKLCNIVTKIHKNTVNMLSQEIQNSNYDLIRESYIYFLSDITNLSILKNKISTIKHTKKLMSIKVTKQPIYYKKIILQIRDDILSKNKKLNDFFTYGTRMTKYNFTLCIAIYLTTFLSEYMSKYN